MRRFVLIALAIALVSAGFLTAEARRLAKRTMSHAYALVDPVGTPEFKVASVVPGRSGRRVYLFHGLREDHRYWERPVLKPLIAGLHARGDELIYVDLPYARAGLLANGGATYCEAFREWLSEQERVRPNARETVAVGVSWGGWHALLATDLVDQTFVLKPVTRVSALDEFAAIETPQCSLRRGHGMAIYAPTDPRVGDATDALRGTRLRTSISASPRHDVASQDVLALLRAM